MLRKRNFFLGVIALILCFQQISFGQGTNAIRMQPFLSGLTLPLYVTSPRDGTGRMFIIQQRGIIKVVQPVTWATSDFLNVSGVVSSSGSERGLLGLAFHPQYTTNRRFFIYYTRQSDGAIEIAEYERSLNDPNVANQTAVRTIITIPHPTFSNHNGGTVLFGPDGYLYAATGDGGSGNDPNNNAQNINSLLGKMLRLDINTPVGQTPAYNIPPTNPYAGATPGLDEIYAIGLRNPYRFSFDRGGSNQLWAGDVGQEIIEEADIVTLGANYGWRVYEGNSCTNLDPGLCTPTNYTMPVFQYSSASGGRCSITGGHVYRGLLRTFGNAAYVHADYCTGEVFQWFNGSQTLRLDTPRLASSFGEDESNELYMTGLGSSTAANGTVEKIVRLRASADFDGDARTDLSVFRPGDGTWYLSGSAGQLRIQAFGLDGDTPTAEDYDGDNVTDISIYRPSTNAWYYYLSSNNTVGVFSFGAAGDIPVPGDYDGDAIGDLAVFRPATGTWWVRRSTDPNNVTATQFGANGDVPVPSDYDADGKVDMAVYRNGLWYRLHTTNGSVTIVQFGLAGDTPTPADFDGDGRSDIAVFRPSTGAWYIIRSLTGAVVIQQWGVNGDVPVAGDYDGDGSDDIAVFRPGNGAWYRINSSNGAVLINQFGSNGDLAIPRYDAP